MSLQELARLKTLALSPDATMWELRQSLCRVTVEHEWLMHTHAALRESTCLGTRVPESGPNGVLRVLPLSPWHGARPRTSEDCAA